MQGLAFTSSLPLPSACLSCEGVLHAILQKWHRGGVPDVSLQPLLREMSVQISYWSLTSGNRVEGETFLLRLWARLRTDGTSATHLHGLVGQEVV